MTQTFKKPSREEAEEAVRTLIRWAGDNPEREGLLETPKRVLDSYTDFFKGYHHDPVAMLEKTFSEIDDYEEMILLKDIRLESYCEHHMVPIIGKVTVAYLPDKRVVGISKLARIVDAYGKRLQIQEKLTAQIANSINDVLQPKGVAVVVSASHHCIGTRGVHKVGVVMQTSHMLGCFKDNDRVRQEFFHLLHASPERFSI